VGSRDPIPTWYFALVVVRLGRRFLVVQETKHEQLWYLPAGRAEPGETLAQAAIRETREEAGIDVVIEGVLRVEHSPTPDGGARVRAIFVARPADDAPLKNTPDEHSQCAEWASLDDLASYELRGEEVREIFAYVANGGPVYPLTVLTREADPWRIRTA
jgi:phosphatase NudJ